MSLASGSPHVIAPDGTSKALQVPGPGPVTAIIERKEKFILVAAHSGAVLIVDPKSFGVLDAIQVRFLLLLVLSDCDIPTMLHGVEQYTD